MGVLVETIPDHCLHAFIITLEQDSLRHVCIGMLHHKKSIICVTL